MQSSTEGLGNPLTNVDLDELNLSSDRGKSKFPAIDEQDYQNAEGHFKS